MSNSTLYTLRQVHEAPRISFLKRIWDHVSEPLLRFRAIDELGRLSDRQLRDIGVDRRQIEAVADREIARLHTGWREQMFPRV